MAHIFYQVISMYVYFHGKNKQIQNLQNLPPAVKLSIFSREGYSNLTSAFLNLKLSYDQLIVDYGLRAKSSYIIKPYTIKQSRIRMRIWIYQHAAEWLDGAIKHFTPNEPTIAVHHNPRCVCG